MPQLNNVFAVGWGGDLGTERLVPGDYRLVRNGLVSPDSRRTIVARSSKLGPKDWDAKLPLEEFLRKSISLSQERKRGLWPEGLWEEEFFREVFLPMYSIYEIPDYGNSVLYSGLMDHMANHAVKQEGPWIHYLSLPPSVYGDYCRGLQAAGRINDVLALEKPRYSHNASISQTWREAKRAAETVVGIEHFLQYQTVPDLLQLLFGDGLVAPTFNVQHVSRVEVTVAEDAGLKGRKHFADNGIVADMGPHVVSMLNMVAMGPPSVWNPQAISSELNQAAMAWVPVDPEEAVLAQYTKSDRHEDYAEECRRRGWRADKPTFMACLARSRNPRWYWGRYQTLFAMRVIKGGPRKFKRVVVTFRKPANSLLSRQKEVAGDRNVELCQSQLIIELDPAPFKVWWHRVAQSAKDQMPFTVKMGRMEGREHESAMDAYDRVLLSLYTGDHSWFVTEEQDIANMQVLAPLENQAEGLLKYPGGTWGPQPEMDNLYPFWHIQD